MSRCNANLGDDGRRLRFNLGEDLTGAENIRVKYIKPVSKTVDYWSAGIDPEDSTKILCEIPGEDLDEKGRWLAKPDFGLDGFDGETRDYGAFTVADSFNY